MLNSPRRIAVVILAIGLGFGAAALTGWEQAPWLAALIGVLLAPLVPAKTACSVARLRAPPDSDGA